MDPYETFLPAIIETFEKQNDFTAYSFHLKVLTNEVFASLSFKSSFLHVYTLQGVELLWSSGPHKAALSPNKASKVKTF